MIIDSRPALVEGDTALIPLGGLAKDGYATIDKEFARLDKYYWHLDDMGYARTTISRKNHRLQHFIVGKPEKGFHVDHINRDRLDNRKANLRHITHQSNQYNSGLWKHNTSGHKGVFWDKERAKWQVRVGRRGFVGRYKTLEEALKARKEAENVYIHI